jgi:glycosyltransferase involved in cell wall biosynthesis
MALSTSGAAQEAGSKRFVGPKGSSYVLTAKLRRIMYLQFADPANYPPLEHSSRLLAERDWQVLMLGAKLLGDQNIKLQPHPRIVTRNLVQVKGRRLQKIQYLYFLAWSILWGAIWRPDWIYASDPLCLPALYVMRKFSRAHMIYHEHDSPNLAWTHSRLMKTVLACRNSLLKNIDLCVVPQRERLLSLVQSTQRTKPTLCVWNLPRYEEAADSDSTKSEELILYYHGSINRFRLPPQLIVAASRFRGAIRVQIAGYETGGSKGYIGELKALAIKEGVANLIDYIGAIPLRRDLLHKASKAHVGLSLMPRISDDFNMRHMVGASNKPFDCMACGLPLLVTDLPDWVETFVVPGYGRACNPEDVSSIASELAWYLEHPGEREEMGRRCKEKVQRSWNYEMGFAPVLEQMKCV